MKQGSALFLLSNQVLGSVFLDIFFFIVNEIEFEATKCLKLSDQIMQIFSPFALQRVKFHKFRSSFGAT